MRLISVEHSHFPILISMNMKDPDILIWLEDMLPSVSYVILLRIQQWSEYRPHHLSKSLEWFLSKVLPASGISKPSFLDRFVIGVYCDGRQKFKK